MSTKDWVGMIIRVGITTVLLYIVWNNSHWSVAVVLIWLSISNEVTMFVFAQQLEIFKMIGRSIK